MKITVNIAPLYRRSILYNRSPSEHFKPVSACHANDIRVAGATCSTWPICGWAFRFRASSSLSTYAASFVFFGKLSKVAHDLRQFVIHVD